MSATRTYGVSGNILSNEEEPGDELGARPITLAIAIQPQKYILRQILGLLAVAQLAIEMAEDTGPIPAHQLGEGILIALAHAQHQHDLGIAEVGIGAARRFAATGGRNGRRGRQSHLQSGDQPIGKRTRNVLPLPSVLSTAM